MATDNGGIPVQKLKENLIALKEFSLCLDRAFKHLLYWSHLAYVLNIDSHVIGQCGLYLEESPTIKLFEYLSARMPELTIRDLKYALIAIQRVDIYIMIDKCFKDEDKVSEVITDSSSDTMDEIALKLDAARKPTGNWKKLAQQVGVPADIYRKFAMYSDYNPTVALVRYLYITRKEPIRLKDFMDCFREMEREDIIREVERIDLDESKEAKEVLMVGSDLLQKIAVLLNRKNAGFEGWRRIGSHFSVDSFIMESLEPPHDKDVHSPTTKVINWLAAARPTTTINDVAEALEKIKRYDALKILRFYFDIGNVIEFGNVPDHVDDADTGDVTYMDTDDADTVDDGTDISTYDDADTGKDVNRRSATPPNTPKVPLKAPYRIGIQATEQSITTIFQGDVFRFGLPSKSKHQIICREKERQELTANLTDKENEMVVLHATPGCGKTTLVVSVAHDIIEDPHYYTVVYVDSKNVFSVKDLACKILTTCGITSSPNHPESQVIQLFSQSNQDCVLILENLDNMYHSMDEKSQTSTSQSGSASARESSWQSTFKKGEFQDFLKDVAKSSPKIKVLVTTWEPVQSLSIKVQQMKLNLFDREQSLELLHLRSKIPITNHPELEPIIKCCGGIPLLLCAAVIFLSGSDSIEAACEQFASSPPQQQLEYLCPDSLPDEERLNYCLGKCFDRMDVCSREVLVLLSVFPNPFTLKEAQHIAKGSEIDEDQLKEGFQSLRKFCFINTHDAESKKYALHPAVRSFGNLKASREEDMKTVFEPARHRYIFYTFDILSEIEEEFFSTHSKSAIEKYRLQDENIREIARWCIADGNMDVGVRKFCIESFIRSQFVLLKTMRSYLLKLILHKFALICQKNEDRKLYCECLTLHGAKIVFGCLCTPHLCPTALQEANVCFCKVIEILINDDNGKKSQDIQGNIDHIYKCEDMSKKAKAQFFLKYGKCLVRHGHNVEGFDSIEKGIDVRKSQDLSNTKNRAMLAMGFEDHAGAYSYKREHIKAISVRKKHVLPTFCKELGMHPFTATAYSQLARNYLELGDYNKAAEANEIALRYRKTLLGNHQDTARSLFDQGAILSEQAQTKADQSHQLYENALPYLQEALDMQKHVLDTPQETALTCQELAFVLTQLGKKEEAEQKMGMITECLKKMKRTTQDDLPRFQKLTSQERDAVGNTGTGQRPLLPNPNEF